MIAYTRERIRVATEAAAAADDLDTISGGVSGDVVTLTARAASQIPTVKHASGNIRLANLRDYGLWTPNRFLFVTLLFDGTNWEEVSRSEWDMIDIKDANKSIPFYPFSGLITQTLAINTTYLPAIYMPDDFRFGFAAARVGTGPVGSACIIDVLYNGVSVFANEGEMCNIAAGQVSAFSTAKNQDYTGGQYFTFRTGSLVGSTTPAANLSVTLACRTSRR